VELSILDAVGRVNETQRRVLGERVAARFGADLSGHWFAIWGLAFKPGTDDMREAPSVAIIESLLRRGARVRAFDPAAMPRAQQIFAARPEIEMAADPLAATVDASALLVVTEWREFRSPDFAAIRELMRTPVLFDGRNLYEPGEMVNLGFEYFGIGRRVVHPAATAFEESQAPALVA
jgi:UDPglucose 6-dehydrogenase